MTYLVNVCYLSASSLSKNTKNVAFYYSCCAPPPPPPNHFNWKWKCRLGARNMGVIGCHRVAMTCFIPGWKTRHPKNSHFSSNPDKRWQFFCNNLYRIFLVWIEQCILQYFSLSSSLYLHYCIFESARTYKLRTCFGMCKTSLVNIWRNVSLLKF